MSQLQLETNITAKFISLSPLSPQEQISLDALNIHAYEITERLQPVLRLLVAEMLDIKREQFTTTKEEYYAGSQQTDLSSNDGTDSGVTVREDTKL
jgi:hypothetical protein